MQSTFASLECASQSELVCLKNTQTRARTHSFPSEKQQSCQAYAYFPKPLSRSCWDLLQSLKWCCVCFYCFLKARCNDAVLHIKHLLPWTQTQRSAFTLTETALTAKHALLTGSVRSVHYTEIMRWHALPCRLQGCVCWWSWELCKSQQRRNIHILWRNKAETCSNAEHISVHETIS